MGCWRSIRIISGWSSKKWLWCGREVSRLDHSGRGLGSTSSWTCTASCWRKAGSAYVAFLFTILSGTSPVPWGLLSFGWGSEHRRKWPRLARFSRERGNGYENEGFFAIGGAMRDGMVCGERLRKHAQPRAIRRYAWYVCPHHWHCYRQRQ